MDGSATRIGNEVGKGAGGTAPDGKSNGVANVAGPRHDDVDRTADRDAGQLERENGPSVSVGEQAPKPPERRRNILALLVEDNQINLLIAQRMLENLRVNVEIARDGLEAVSLFQSKRFDIVLMDCQMPNMDGYEATVNIRRLEAERGGRTPIVAVSASALHDERVRCFDVGMDDHVSKPLTLNMLRTVIEKWS